MRINTLGTRHILECQNALPLYRFPEASSPRKWAQPTGVVYEHILINLTSCLCADMAY